MISYLLPTDDPRAIRALPTDDPPATLDDPGLDDTHGRPTDDPREARTHDSTGPTGISTLYSV